MAPHAVLRSRQGLRPGQGSVFWALSCLALAACGDALLPADYTGPPALAVGGSVIRAGDVTALDVENPRLSLVWLTELTATAPPPTLVVQPVAFQRSQQLQKDWDIGIGTPLEAAKISGTLGATGPRMAIGQMVYFDDRDGDGQFGWSCTGPRCDEIKAISTEFVVYLDQPLVCQSHSELGTETKIQLGSGFHSFALIGSGFEERPLSGDLQFVLHEPPPVWSESLAGLQNFANQLTRAYQLNALGGCGAR